MDWNILCCIDDAGWENLVIKSLSFSWNNGDSHVESQIKNEMELNVFFLLFHIVSLCLSFWVLFQWLNWTALKCCLLGRLSTVVWNTFSVGRSIWMGTLYSRSSMWFRLSHSQNCCVILFYLSIDGHLPNRERVWCNRFSNVLQIIILLLVWVVYNAK